MAITVSKQKALLIGIIVLTLFLGAAAVVTAILLQSKPSVAPTPSKAATTVNGITFQCTTNGNWDPKAINANCTSAHQVCGNTDQNCCSNVSLTGLPSSCSNTFTCTNQGICDACASGYVLSNNTCVPSSTVVVQGADCTNPGYAGKVTMIGTNGGGLKIINCTSTAYQQTLPVQQFTCTSNTGDPGTTGRCSSNPTSLAGVAVNIAAGDVNGFAALPVCSVSCGSCQTDISVPAGSNVVPATDGKFVSAATSCSTTTSTTAPVTTTAVTTTTAIVTTTATSTRVPQDTPTQTPTATPTETPSGTPTITTVVPTTTAVPKNLPNTGLWEDLVMPTLIAVAFVGIAAYLVNRPAKK